MIEGRVARVLGDQEIIINRGREDGVKDGMVFVIYAEGDHITDPDTQEDLGAVETVKGKVGVYHVQDKMSRARTLTYQVKSPSGGGLSALLATGATSTQTKRRKLIVRLDEANPLDEDLHVRVGDMVHSVGSDTW